MGLILNVTFHSPLETFSHNLTPTSFDVYLKGRADGLLSETGVKAQAFLVSTIAKNEGERDWPDIQSIWGVGSVQPGGKYFAEMGVVLGRPKGTGTLKLNTKQYLKGERRNTRLAVIDYQLFQNEEDVLRALEGTFVPNNNLLLYVLSNQTKKKVLLKVRVGTPFHFGPYQWCRNGMGSTLSLSAEPFFLVWLESTIL